MPNIQQSPITYLKLYESPLISVFDYRCHAYKSSAGDEEVSENNSIVLLRNGNFAKHFAKRNIFADVNQIVFFSKKSIYRISHPTDHGDRGTYFLVAPRILNDIVREFDPTIDERPDQPFPFVNGPCSTQIFWKHRDIIRHLKLEPFNELWADQRLLQWIAEVLRSAFEKHGQPKKLQRSSTKLDHAEKAEAAKAFLASHL